MSYRTLSVGQRSQVWIAGPDLSDPKLLFETDDLLVEAPNWTTDGAALIVNGAGQVWRLEVEGEPAGLVKIDYQDLPDVNNDHVLDPDGEHIYLSAMDQHIYRAALAGGAPSRVSPEDGYWHFLHGVSPDGSRLAYVEIDTFDKPGRLAVLAVGSDSPEIWPAGDGHLDGPEWSPDGKWVYLNSEAFTEAPGHAQLARVPDGGGPIERLVSSDTVDWFPHVSPDARYAAYISFPTGTVGHPPDRDVEVRVVDTSDWSSPLQRYPLFGGQGTINVNSWAPDSRRFAFVAYPVR
jgi:TolB protein